MEEPQDMIYLDGVFVRVILMFFFKGKPELFMDLSLRTLGEPCSL